MKHKGKTGTAPICTCGKPAQLTTRQLRNPNKTQSRRQQAEVPVWACEACDMRVGCHPGSTVPLGTLADKLTRTARSSVHSVLDARWSKFSSGVLRRLAREQNYARLASEMGLPQEQCHVGLFTLEQCNRAIDLVLKWDPL